MAFRSHSHRRILERFFEPCLRPCWLWQNHMGAKRPSGNCEQQKQNALSYRYHKWKGANTGTPFHPAFHKRLALPCYP